MTTLTKWSFAGQPLYVFSPSPAEPPHNPRHLQISVITSAVEDDMAAATALLKIADCTMLFEPNPTTLLSFGGSIPVTAIQINMLAVSGKDLQCGRDPQMNTLIFADTEWSLSTGRQLCFLNRRPFLCGVPLFPCGCHLWPLQLTTSYVWRLHFLNTQLRQKSLCVVMLSRLRSTVFQPSLVAMEVGDRQLAHKNRASESCLGSNVMA